ncbi:MAG: zincin-like metallopeptidase domain-containing protein, partial [bacterium]
MQRCSSASPQGKQVAFGGEGAFYRPLTDTIHMPDRTRFVGSATSSATECLYSTLLHELTHWTGIKTRCDREFGKRFGDDAYAMEELVAELGAAFLCADLG